MKFTFLLLIIFLLVPKLSFSTENYRFTGNYYHISYESNEKKQIINLRGEVLSGLIEDLTGFEKVISLIKPNIDIDLVLHSGGGFQVKFNALYNKIKNSCQEEIFEETKTSANPFQPASPPKKIGWGKSRCKIRTIIDQYSHCASACIPLFMAGMERIAHRDARFGFHQAAVLPGALKIPKMAQKSLRTNGVSEEWLKKNAYMFDSLDFTWLNPIHLDGSNIVTKIAR